VGYGGSCFTGGEDDMSIPCAVEAPLPQLEKYNHKNLNGYIFDSVNGVGRRIITSMDILPLASMAEKARKTKNLHTMLIIGGIALVITGTIVAIHIINKNKNDDNSDMADAENIDVSIADDIDVSVADDIDVSDAEDIPVVELDAE